MRKFIKNLGTINKGQQDNEGTGIHIREYPFAMNGWELRWLEIPFPITKIPETTP